jgi:hypothetical protein
MEEILKWSELVAYMTASLAAFIYICDTSFIYLSGVRKFLREKNKEKQKIKEEYISASLNGSRESTPNGSMIMSRVSQHPQFRRNYAIERSFVQSPLPLQETIIDMEPAMRDNSERSTLNPIYNPENPHGDSYEELNNIYKSNTIRRTDQLIDFNYDDVDEQLKVMERDGKSNSLTSSASNSVSSYDDF